MKKVEAAVPAVRQILCEVELALLNLAQNHAPPGTEPAALAHQWAHAIVSDSALYGGDEDLKNEVRELLQSAHLLGPKRLLASKLEAARAVTSDVPSNFSFIDLFAGIGGMRIGFQNAGGLCVFSSELDRYAQATYKANHGELPFGDITKIEPTQIPHHDVLLAGFPCQPFSHAGLKRGIEDTRGTLFYNIAQILSAKTPRYALLENVRGLISHQGGQTLRVILKALTDIGYECNIPSGVIRNGSTKEIQAAAKEMVLRSVDFGVPQNRQRIYIVLWLEGEAKSFSYPQASRSPTKVGDILVKNPPEKYRISDRLWNGHKRRKSENARKGKGFGFGIVNPDSPYTNTLSARYYKDGSEVLVEDIPGRNPRKLTPREAARLQGFPDSFEVHPSDVQAYKQFGNSVSVPVIEAIARQIAASIAKRENNAS